MRSTHLHKASSNCLEGGRTRTSPAFPKYELLATKYLVPARSRIWRQVWFFTGDQLRATHAIFHWFGPGVFDCGRVAVAAFRARRSSVYRWLDRIHRRRDAECEPGASDGAFGNSGAGWSGDIAGGSRRRELGQQQGLAKSLEIVSEPPRYRNNTFLPLVVINRP